MAIKAVLFDADNTLFDTRAVARRCDGLAIGELSGFGFEKKELAAALKEIVLETNKSSDPSLRTRKYAYGLLAKKAGAPAAKVRRAVETFESCVLSNLEPVPGAKGLLDALRGKYKLAVLTAENRGWALRKLEANGLKKYFDAIITATEVGKMKPHTGYYSLACGKLKVRPGECVMVGDDEKNDLVPARKLGMKAYGPDFEKLLSILL